MSLNIVDKRNNKVEFAGFVVMRRDIMDARKGSVYPFGFSTTGSGEVLILDDATELHLLHSDNFILFEEGARYVTVNLPYETHDIKRGDLAVSYDSLPYRNINAGCVWLKSYSEEHDYFAVRDSSVTPTTLRWTAQAYRYRMQAAQEHSKRLGAARIVVVEAPKPVDFVPFTPEEPLTRYVTVEFNAGGKQYTYLLPNHLTAMKGDDAVVVVNNPNYPELKGTKVVRITGVYDRNPSDYYDNSLKRIEHVVSKSAERRKELEQKINDKRIQLRQAEKRVATMADQLTKLEEDLVNGTY